MDWVDELLYEKQTEKIQQLERKVALLRAVAEAARYYHQIGGFCVREKDGPCDVCVALKAAKDGGAL